MDFDLVLVCFLCGFVVLSVAKVGEIKAKSVKFKLNLKVFFFKFRC